MAREGDPGLNLSLTCVFDPKLLNAMHGQIRGCYAGGTCLRDINRQSLMHAATQEHLFWPDGMGVGDK